MPPYPLYSLLHGEALWNGILWIYVFTQVQIDNEILAEGPLLCWVIDEHLMVPRLEEVCVNIDISPGVFDSHVWNIDGLYVHQLISQALISEQLLPANQLFVDLELLMQRRGLILQVLANTFFAIPGNNRVLCVVLALANLEQSEERRPYHL